MLTPGADLGVGRGGRGPPFCPGIFFFCKQRLLDGTSCFVTLDIFSLINIINKKIYRTLCESTTLINTLQTDKLEDVAGVSPVTSATVECSNSSLYFVKSGFRSTMREDHLNALLLFIHKDIALDYDAITDDYDKLNQRRMTFIVNPLQ